MLVSGAKTGCAGIAIGEMVKLSKDVSFSLSNVSAFVVLERMCQFLVIYCTQFTCHWLTMEGSAHINGE